jgi:murein L,D-transpeptidase YcbB/YkuD
MINNGQPSGGLKRRKALLLFASTAIILAAVPEALLAETAEKKRGFFARLFGAKQPAPPPPPAPRVAPTRTELVQNIGVRPMLDVSSERMMYDAVARYEIIVARGGWRELPMPKKPLKLGKKDNLVPYLRLRLAAESYLPFQPVQNNDNYDAEVEAAVRHYQTTHGLHAHGELDARTVEELNVPAGARLETLRANLPRVQEYTRDLGAKYIAVNIPAAQLEAVEFGIVHSRHNIVVGKPDRPSPVVSSQVTELNFNPYWNAPASIVQKDIIPKYLEDPTLLEKMNIRVYDGWNGPEIDPSTIDWRNTSPERYLFRQQPGDENAMASVKINFHNPYAVYMHDTPTKELFTEASRYFSSGCVRVEEVHVLTDWILAGQDGWDRGRIESVVQSGERLDVKVANPPQVRWVYLTAWVDSDGFLNFRDDIYSLDGTGFVTGQPVGIPRVAEKAG